MALGTIYDRQGQAEKAEAFYRKALEVREDFAPAANNLAWNLAQREIKLNEALDLARLAKKHLPEDPNVMDTLGWVYYLQESYQNAVAELQDSVAKNPDNAITNYHLGKALYKIKEYEKAREYLAKALELDPDFSWADDARRFVK
jgi:tetratricopeptide (TPR) repeat protein